VLHVDFLNIVLLS